jgi:hypothetical protein
VTSINKKYTIKGQGKKGNSMKTNVEGKDTQSERRYREIKERTAQRMKEISIEKTKPLETKRTINK